MAAARPQHDSAALASATEALQAAAARLLDADVPLEDVEALATAATAYAAEHAKADLTRPGTMTETSPVFRGAMATVSKVRAVPLPLVPAPQPVVQCTRPGCAHPHSWHGLEYGCMAGECPCPAFQPPTPSQED